MLAHMSWQPLPVDVAEWMGMDDDYLRPDAAASYELEGSLNSGDRSLRIDLAGDETQPRRPYAPGS